MQPGFVTHTAQIENSIIIIKGVPALICEQCGEIWLEGATTRRIEQIVLDIESTLATEVAIVKYTALAA
jgi:YgiT-type zinc finger domain-containing protein